MTTGTFRVDGVSRQRILEQARRTVEQYDRGNKRMLTEAEWEKRVADLTANRYATGRPVPLAEFATPQGATTFLEICQARGAEEFRELCLMELYNTGAVDEKTKTPITAWRPFQNRAAA